MNTKNSLTRASAAIFIGTLLAAQQCLAADGELKLFWNSVRGDNFSTATAQGEADARAAGYSYVRLEGRVEQSQLPGTVPLKLFWNWVRGDNMLTATPEGERDAVAAGYQFVRIEGYVYRMPAANTAALDQYWAEARGDNFVTASQQGRIDALQAGYAFVRTEGYIKLTSSQCMSQCRTEKANCTAGLPPRDPEIKVCTASYNECTKKCPTN